MLQAYSLSYTLLAYLDDDSIDAAHNIVLTQNLNGIDSLTFEIPMNSSKWQYLINENLVKYDTEYYFIKLPTFIDNLSKENVTIDCIHLSSGLQTQLNGSLLFTAVDAKNMLIGVLTERFYGWTLDTADIDYSPSILREFSSIDQSVFSNLVKVAEIFDGFLLFNSVTKKVKFKQSLPNRDIILTRGVNLKSVNLGYDTSQISTRMYPFGAKDIVGQDVNIITVNAGKPYLDDFSYYLTQGYTQPYIDAHPELFLHEVVWRQPTYYSPTDLKNDATTKLATISQPIVEVTMNALDLSSLPEFFATSPILGEDVRIIDASINLDITTQIISIQKNSEQPIALSIQISNERIYTSILQELVRTDKLVNIVSNEPTGETSGYHIQAKTVTADKIQVGTNKTIAVSARGGSTNSTPSTRALYLDAVSETIPVGTGLTLVVLDRTNYTVDSAINYDVFNVPGDIVALTSALNALTNSKVVILMSQGKISVDASLMLLLERCGASAINEAYITAHPDTPYILLGVPFAGKGMGLEVLSGDTTSDPPATISTFIVDGVPQGMVAGFTQTTIIDGGQITTGTLDADIVNVTNLNADNITAGTLSGIQIQQISGTTVLADMFKDTNGGVIKVYDIGGLLNAKIGSESGAGDNVGGTLILYNDGAALTDRRVALGIATVSDSGIMGLFDSNGDERIFFNGRSTGPFMGILNTSLVFKTVLTDAYADSPELRENGIALDNKYLQLIGGTLTGDLIFNNVLSAGNKIIDLQQSYILYSDNAGAGGNNTRLWLDTPNNGEVIVGPRTGANYLGQTRLRSKVVRVEAGTGSGKYIIMDASFTGGTGTEPVIKPSSDTFGTLGTSTNRWWRGYAVAWLTTSTEAVKCDIVDEDLQYAYDMIKITPIHRYRMIKEKDTMGEDAPYYVGAISEECDHDFTDDTGTCVNTYSMLSTLIAGTQKLIADSEQMRIDIDTGGGGDLEQRIIDLENANTTLTQTCSDLTTHCDDLEARMHIVEVKLKLV